MPDTKEINSRFYESLWSRTYLERPERFNTWPLVSGLLQDGQQRLEIGPGMRPRLPVSGTHFIDRSNAAVEPLCLQGGMAQCGDVCELPFADRSFDLVCAFDVIEHVEDSRLAFSEVSRVVREDGILVFSVPLHRDRMSEFDRLVGHAHRFDTSELLALLDEHHLFPEKYAPFGMQPENPWLLNCGMWFLRHHSRQAIFWYNRILMPLGLFFQKPLEFTSNLGDASRIDEIVCVCTRRGGTIPPG